MEIDWNSLKPVDHKQLYLQLYLLIYIFVQKGGRMPQISLYIDNDTIKKIERAAKLENKSISKWAASRIKLSLEKKWPDDWFSLFGAIKDDSFTEPEELNSANDNFREKL